MQSSFGARSTTDEVLAGNDLSGKRVLVTGVSTGLGAETMRALVARGAHVIGAARDLDKAAKAAKALQPAFGGGYELVALDLASLASVRACAAALVAEGKPLDVIIANAGIMACPFSRTADGFEMQFGTNHLGHFVLINGVASLLRPGGRVVMLASRGHRVADVDLDDPNFERTAYEEIAAYGRSKTANILFAVEFDRRYRDRGIRATALHPGGIRTELMRHLTHEKLEQMRQISAKGRGDESPAALVSALKTLAQGAATSVWAGFVANADAIGGHYCEDCHVAEVVEGMADKGVRSYALDPDRARALWALSEKLTGTVGL